MRIGFTVGNPELIKALTTVKNSFNHFPVDVICKTAAKAALQSFEYYEKITKEIVETRTWFTAELEKKRIFSYSFKNKLYLCKKRKCKGN